MGVMSVDMLGYGLRGVARCMVGVMGVNMFGYRVWQGVWRML